MELIKRNTDYALRALVHMAETKHEGNYALAELAAATGAPETFLRKVVQKLDLAGVVETKRGRSGGVCFSKDPEEITVLEVVEAVQGPVAINKCFVTDRACAERSACLIRRNLGAIQNDLTGLLRAATVGQLAGQNKTN